MRLSIKAIAGTAALAGLLFVGGSPAGAQDDPVDCGYLGDACGDQTLEFSYPDEAEAGEEIEVEGNLSPVLYTPIALPTSRGSAEGEGVSQADEVNFTIGGEAAGSLPIDDDGDFEGTITVPDLDPGDTTIVGTTGLEPIDMLPDTARITAEGPITITAPGGGGGGGGGGTDPGGSGGTTSSTTSSTSSGSSSPLARTGFEQAPMITLGAAALVLGGAAVVGSRRRMAR